MLQQSGKGGRVTCLQAHDNTVVAGFNASSTVRRNWEREPPLICAWDVRAARNGATRVFWRRSPELGTRVNALHFDPRKIVAATDTGTAVLSWPWRPRAMRGDPPLAFFPARGQQLHALDVEGDVIAVGTTSGVQVRWTRTLGPREEYVAPGFGAPTLLQRFRAAREQKRRRAEEERAKKEAEEAAAAASAVEARRLKIEKRQAARKALQRGRKAAGKSREKERKATRREKRR